MASPFEGVDALAVEISPKIGREGKGRDSRGMDTFKRWRYFLGVNRNYNIL